MLKPDSLTPDQLLAVFIAAAQGVTAQAMQSARATGGSEGWARLRAEFDAGLATGRLQVDFTAEGKVSICAVLVGTWQGQAKAIEVHRFPPQDSMSLMAQLWSVPWPSASPGH